MPETAEKSRQKLPEGAGRQQQQETGRRLEASAEELAAETVRRQTALRTQRGDSALVWDALAADFPQHDLEKLPKPLKAKDENKGRCQEEPGNKAGPYYSADGYYCGGWHARALHLDYVGHAGITDRLNKVLGPGGWTLEPASYNEAGVPVVASGAFWARLTVRVGEQEVTKMDVAANFSGPQEMWGDALRRCAMRFGVGTYLWAKSEAALERKRATDEPPEPEPQQQHDEGGPVAQMPHHVQIVLDQIADLHPTERADLTDWWSQAEQHGGPLPPAKRLNPDQAAYVVQHIGGIIDGREQGPAGDPGPDPWDSKPAGSWQTGQDGALPPA